MRRHLRSAALPILLAAILASACKHSAPAASPAPPARAAVDRPSAEALISADEARADVAWLADPERQGRGVGTPGNAAAARFVGARMRSLGLVPAGADEWYQPFDAPVRAAIRPATAFALAGAPLALGKDFQPFTFSDDGKAEGELVWAGYGITAPALGWDDYAGLDVKGKIVVVAAHFPNEQDPASPFRDPKEFQYGEWRYKATNARDHGAVALIAVRDPWHHPGDAAGDTLPAWKGAPSSRAGILAASVTLAALERAGADPRGLAAASNEHHRPHSGPLGVQARLTIEIAQESATTANVVGLLPASGASDECVVVGAHYDHLGYGGEASLAPDRIGEVHPGADDNASGVAALLQVGKALAALGPLPRPVLLVAFGGEELGLLGSSWFVKHGTARCPIEKLQLMVNLDMVGRPRAGKLYVEGAATAKGLRERVAALAHEAPAVPLTVAWGQGDGFGPSDHTSFYAKGVPVLFFFTGAHADYHRPTDTADKVDPRAVAEVARLAFRAVADAAASPARLEVVRGVAPSSAPAARGERERGYGAYLGTIPDFEERKEPGVLVSGVRAGSPAEQGGLAAGDVLLQVGATRILNLQDLTVALRSHRPGDLVEVIFRRGGETRTVKVTLQERR
jgi:hypothetical protein